MAVYEWKQYIFEPKDFDGSGQYIVRETPMKIKSPHINDTGFLSTILMKIGWTNSARVVGYDNTYAFLIDMSDGLIKMGYYITKDEEGNDLPTEMWKWISFSGPDSTSAKQTLCDYLNNNPHGNTYRFATHEELVRVAMYQKHRTR